MTIEVMAPRGNVGAHVLHRTSASLTSVEVRPYRVGAHPRLTSQ